MIQIRVGIIGTGYVAKTRAELFKTDTRSQLIAVAGHSPESTQAFAQQFNITPEVSWRKLIERDDIDLITICSVNRDHDMMTEAALENNKHVIVEYPLSLNPEKAQSLIALSQQKQKLLHVEHIELLGGLHNGIKDALDKIGQVFYARYITLSAKHPAPQKWTYQPSLFGFPFIGALSRLHRLIDLFGTVNTVQCQSQFWQTQPDYYNACLCNAQLKFNHGIIAEAVYGKGDVFWQSENTFTLYGEQGTLIFTPKQGQLIQAETVTVLEVGTRRGSFARDTHAVLDYLCEETPLYMTPEESCYTLQVADAARESSESGEIITIKSR
ncbi:MAG: Gfo/Idh/MocA family oxidoreductase [Microcoleaceae cyanobacterium]